MANWNDLKHCVRFYLCRSSGHTSIDGYPAVSVSNRSLGNVQCNTVVCRWTNKSKYSDVWLAVSPVNVLLFDQWCGRDSWAAEIQSSAQKDFRLKIFLWWVLNLFIVWFVLSWFNCLKTQEALNYLYTDKLKTTFLSLSIDLFQAE